MNPLPYMNKIENKRKTLFEIIAFVNALARNGSRFSDSIFSFENTIKPNPEMSNNRISSSAKFVLKVTNIFVSKNEEYIAKTGILNLKSNKKYRVANAIPVRVRSQPANFQG